MIKYSSRILVLGLTAALLAIPSAQAFAQSTSSPSADSVTGTDPEPPPPPPPSTMQYVLLIIEAAGG